jgi:hypothetical protein
MKGTHILALIATTLWALVLIMGLGGIDSVRSQHALGYPSAGQVRFYVYLPATVLVVVVAAWALSIYRRQLKTLAAVLITLSLLVLPGYLFFYTGGI